MAVAVDRREAADDEALFALYEAVFGAKLTEGSRRRWRWQYLENPLHDEEGLAIWVARDGDAVLGQYASMPVRLWWGDREVRSSWGMDVFLRPEARGRGLGAQLFTTWADHVDVALGLGLTPSSYGLFKRLEYNDVGPVPFLQKILDTKAVVARRAGAFAGVVGPIVDLGLGMIQRARPVSESGGVEVRRVDDFSAEYDALWESARASYAMCVRRDRRYLRWKYRSCPKAYAVHEARRGNDLAGFAVSRTEDHEGLRLGWIIDVFADARDRGVKDALIGSVLDAFADENVARAQAFAMNGPLREDLKNRGFLSGSSPMQFCVRSRVGGSAFQDMGAWHVVFGDSDMDR